MGIGILIFVFVLGSMIPFVLGMAYLLVSLFALIIVAELYQLYRMKKGLEAKRDAPSRLSNGDNNQIYISLRNHYPFDCNYELIDELPEQFQSRDISFFGSIGSDTEKTIQYSIRPVDRGEYYFGKVNVYVSTFTHMLLRRYQFGSGNLAKVYPSIIQVKKFAFTAISDHLQDVGIKKIRKIGHNYEFDQIREFVEGDDVRSINWTATARSTQLMVNQYQDEKSQDVYTIINKGRVMQMPFNGLTLLDYAINSSLVMLNTAYTKDDHPGLITFNKQVETMIPASKKKTQITTILETLYNQETDFSEADYIKLTYWIRRKIKRRALVFLYTNFEGVVSLKREIEHLKTIAQYQRLIIIIFKNVEIDEMVGKESHNLESIYTKTIATKFQAEKHLIIKELHRHGIDSILTSPEDLTVNSINKYLEIKKRGLL
ncbi:MAG: DUF58 domain-containing protein [Reichenbachiella sp.]|uniref:DUF58 domain-containing protein n=1 Tax=Reichenbachiella sp. TaxID=2184521 RepID=UPI003299EF68